jgi:hypothetical protein
MLPSKNAHRLGKKQKISISCNDQIKSITALSGPHKCGLKMDRDHNAAKVIEYRGVVVPQALAA